MSEKTCCEISNCIKCKWHIVKPPSVFAGKCKHSGVGQALFDRYLINKECPYFKTKKVKQVVKDNRQVIMQNVIDVINNAKNQYIKDAAKHNKDLSIDVLGICSEIIKTLREGSA